MIRTGTHFDPESKIWSGPELPQIYNPDVSVGQIILSAISGNPNKVVQISASDGSSMTNRELELRSIRIAEKLLRLDLEQGDVIGIVARNTENLAPLVVAALTCGFPVSALDVSFGDDEILHIYGCTRPKVVFCDEDVYETMKRCITNLKLNSHIVLMKGQLPGVSSVTDYIEPTGHESDFIPPKLKKGGNEIALMGNSSGTSGPAKAVCISHALLVSQFHNLFLGTMDDVIFVSSPIYWATWWMNFLYSSAKGATRIITEEPFSPKLLLQIIEEYKVTIVLTAATYMIATTKSPEIESHDLSSVRAYLCAGCTLPKTAVEKMNSHLKNGSIIFGYGMTEIITYFAIQSQPVAEIESVGKLVNNNKVKLVNENGEQLGINETGEILVKSPVSFSGYYKDPEATKRALDEEGWLHTGDIGYFNEDGYLFVVDRKKDVFKHKGFHIVPSVIESVLLSLPGVLEACVVGVKHPVSVEIPAAAIVKRPDSQMTEKDIFTFVASQFSAHKNLVGGVYFFETLPKTLSGKVLRRNIRETVNKLYREKNKELY